MENGNLFLEGGPESSKRTAGTAALAELKKAEGNALFALAAYGVARACTKHDFVKRLRSNLAQRLRTL
jgi:hypothetical protein